MTDASGGLSLRSTRTALRHTGALRSLSVDDIKGILDRAPIAESDVGVTTSAIIRDVRQRGDRALFELAKRFDAATIESLEVPPLEREKALNSLEPAVRRAMDRAAGNIASVHRASLPLAMETEPEPGVRIGRRPDPLERVGVYAPGGRAAYPSSVLMGVIPARVAGVGEVILCSPPDSTGSPASVVLAAAQLAGVDRVFAVGGAGAIAAMAFGTKTIPRVDRIVGPGNQYVAEAKLQVVNAVAIDAPAGPTELLVIADDSADPQWVATELVAQAEHDPLACVVAICLGGQMAEQLIECLDRILATLPRAGVVAQALVCQGAVLSAGSIDEALDFASAYAPEHLLLAVGNADALLPRVRNAGTVFVGGNTSVAFGDYMTGANHVLPTGGLARAYSGLSVLDFFRWTTYQRIDRAAASRLARDTRAFALAEGLSGHALAAGRWEAPE